MVGRTSVRSKTGLSERAGKRRNERSKRQERFKNGNIIKISEQKIKFHLAYEFPKPADDIKDAQVPNVDAIRGGLSFRGLMRQRAGATVRHNTQLYFSPTQSTYEIANLMKYLSVYSSRL